MKKFRVWVSRLEDASRLRVDGRENATWLLRRLSNSFVFKTSAPLGEAADFSDCTFHIAHNSQMCGATFERLLAGIAEVQLMVEPGQHG